MKIPNFLDRRTLAKMASENETHCIRVILGNTSNPAPYTVPCKYRRYLFERNGTIGAHVLDFPLSVWMDGTPKGRYGPNKSVSEDLKPTARLPFTIQVIPWYGATPTEKEDPQALRGAFSLLREIFTALNPPPVVFKALQHAENNEMEQLTALSASSKEPASGETPRQLQARKMREAKMKKRTELQTAAQ